MWIPDMTDWCTGEDIHTYADDPPYSVDSVQSKSYIAKLLDDEKYTPIEGGEGKSDEGKKRDIERGRNEIRLQKNMVSIT